MTTYEHEQRIGSGGFGEVFKARSKFNNTLVAIKYLRDTDSHSAQRFDREVRCLEKLSHPNIVTILAKQLNREPFYYVMPLYDHSLLFEIPAVQGNLPRISQLFQAILDGLRYAHSEGVLHRDLKPENVLISHVTNSIAVNDFGLGRIVTSSSTRLTMTGLGMGTPFYCAPEQIASAKDADERSDIYSLGRILYDLFGGLNQQVVDLEDVPISIASIIRRSMRKNPQERFQSVTALSEAFGAAMELLMGSAATASLEALLDECGNGNSVSTEQFRQLRVAVSQNVEDGEVLHEMLMKITPAVFAQLVSTDPELMRRVVRTFAKFQENKVWAFSYTDTIGRITESLFEYSSDPVVRARLLSVLLVVGTNHNRWEVMRRFGKLLQELKSSDEAITVRDELTKFAKELEHVTSYVERAKLNPILRPLFP